MAGATKKQWDMGLDVVRYLKGAKDLELTYRRHDGCDGLAVVAYADSDFANDKASANLVNQCMPLYGYVVYERFNNFIPYLRSVHRAIQDNIQNLH
jgi:hypothetical protein